MKIAFLSGKGGAGKTFLAVNLAYYARCREKSVGYFDCDVEEPNGHLFFSDSAAEKESEETVYTSIPSFDKEKCTACRACVNFCRFNALVFIKKAPVLLKEMCHACGGCKLVCPEKAVTETKRPIGVTEKRIQENVSCYSGVLNIGEASGIKIIQALLKKASHDFCIIDCPPGSACSVMESIEDADLCVLVAEPTSFGLHNLQMAYELTQVLHKKTAVVINKEQETPFTPLTDFCSEKKLPVIARIPFDKKLGKVLAEGKIAVKENENFSGIMKNIYTQIKAMA